jgi:hypothetical protein
MTSLGTPTTTPAITTANNSWRWPGTELDYNSSLQQPLPSNPSSLSESPATAREAGKEAAKLRVTHEAPKLSPSIAASKLFASHGASKLEQTAGPSCWRCLASTALVSRSTGNNNNCPNFNSGATTTTVNNNNNNDSFASV